MQPATPARAASADPSRVGAAGDALYQIGWELYQRDAFVQAADVFRFLVVIAPSRSDAWWALGACHEQRDDHAVAAEVYETGYRSGEQDLDLGLLCARARSRAGDLVGARRMIAELRGEARDAHALGKVCVIERSMCGGPS